MPSTGTRLACRLPAAPDVDAVAAATPIQSRGLGDANRTAYWCPACQPDRFSGEGGIRTLEEGLPHLTP